ncbi:AK9 [Bugula neritina]|uniref:AK9 n=1 Tax=Bugula neritina TaxID=10212 RepID=A0A7J7JLV5_BUGNE|nr:AK9 [Bugula neritina]
MEIMVRATKDRLDPERVFPKHDSSQIATVKINTYNQHIEEVRKWYRNEHMNYDIIKVEKSKWWVWNEAVELAKKSVCTIQTYLERVADGKAASVYDLCITPSEFNARLGDFSHYCPVRLADGELVNCGVSPSLLYAVEFRGFYYKCAGEKERDMFLAEAEKYVPPLAPRRLPPADLLPKRITAEEAKSLFPMPLEIKGYCPVTFLDGKLRYEAIIPGNMEIGCVLYRNKLYAFESEDKLLKFLR